MSLLNLLNIGLDAAQNNPDIVRSVYGIMHTQPAHNVSWVTPTYLNICIAMAGLDPSSTNINFNGSKMTVSGKTEIIIDGVHNYIKRDIIEGDRNVVVILPICVSKMDLVKVNYNNGMVLVRIDVHSSSGSFNVKVSNDIDTLEFI
jgi:HSP20 family molecular chaperone IbpA